MNTCRYEVLPLGNLQAWSFYWYTREELYMDAPSLVYSIVYYLDDEKNQLWRFANET